MKNTPVMPVFTPMPPKECWGVIKTINALEGYLGPKVEDWPEFLRKLKQTDAELAIQSLGIAIAFLEESLISEMTLSTGEFFEYTPET